MQTLSTISDLNGFFDLVKELFSVMPDILRYCIIAVFSFLVLLSVFKMIS